MSYICQTTTAIKRNNNDAHSMVDFFGPDAGDSLFGHLENVQGRRFKTYLGTHTHLQCDRANASNQQACVVGYSTLYSHYQFDHAPGYLGRNAAQFWF